MMLTYHLKTLNNYIREIFVEKPINHKNVAKDFDTPNPILGLIDSNTNNAFTFLIIGDTFFKANHVRIGPSVRFGLLKSLI